MNNRISVHIEALEFASAADLIELLKEKDQVLQAVTEVNYQLSCERDLFQREADYYKSRCIKYQVEEKRRQQAGAHP